ncbi:MAG: hypothetical protein IT168_29305 [Bryobacterales bacterium]|nr:hypothetical protein [Bryobacterales bacterium]
MTNTLHRYGSSESFNNDIIIFAIACRGKNDEGALPKLKQFLEMAIPFGPVNLGDARNGGSVRPCYEMNPTQHWNRDIQPDFRKVIDGLTHITTVAAVFDDKQKAIAFMKKVREADLSVSINISTSVDGADEICEAAGFHRHSVGYSLGFEGKTEKLPNTQVLTLMTMCGHGMVASSLAKKMIDWVKEGRRTPEEAATYMQRFCSCGVFNPVRAAQVLDEARHSSK